MKAGMPWSVKGIEPEAREAAKDAARRSGMTLGEWLNSVISEQAEGGETEPMAARTSRPYESFERATSKLEDIATQLAKLAQRDQPASSGNYGVYPAQSQAQDNEQINRILGRLEANERQSVDAFTAVNDRLATLGRQFAQAAKAATTFKPEEHPSFQALEKAVRNIVEHLESSEKRTRDNFKMMQDRVSDMSSKAQAAPNDNVLRQAPAFTKLEQRLSELSQRVEQSEKTPPPPAISDLLRNELRELAKRIDTVRETAESLATRAQTQAVQTSQQELRAIEQRILGLLNETQQTFAQGSVSDHELQRIRADVDALNKRIDQSRQTATSDREVQTLKSAVEQLSTRVAQGPDMRPLQDMDRRIVELAQRINEQQSAPAPAYSELEHRLVELDHKLDYAIQNMGTQASDGLSQQLVAVGERLDRAESQLSHLSTIERAISQLYEGLEESRNSAHQLAEDAANRATQNMLAHLPSAVGTSAPSLELQALEQGLEAVRESAQVSDHRNQETLLALHETLEHIVSKLSELETATIGQRIAVAAGVPTPAPAYQEPAHAVPQAPEPGTPFAEVAKAATQQMQDMRRDSGVFNGDSIPTSAYQFPDSTPASAPAATPTTETSLADNEPKLMPQTSEGALPGSSDQSLDDFIAAARRAAQASQPASAGKTTSFPGIGPRPKKKESGSLIGGLLGKLSSGKKAPRTVADELRTRPAVPSIEPAPAVPQTKFRKSLLIAGLLLLGLVAAVSSGKISSVLKFSLPAKVSELTKPFIADPEPASSQSQKADAQVEGQTASIDASASQPDQIEPAVSAEAPTVAVDEILTGTVAPAASAQLENIVSGKATSTLALPPAQIGSEKLRAEAAAGNANAQFVIASRFMDGERISRDFEQAALWYERAAASGLAPAQYRMATLYERGRGLPRDLSQAQQWYEKAAALGNVRSMHNAAVIAAGTDLGKPDYERAKKWFSLSANHGLKDSQFNLAVLLERGLAGKSEPAEALFWYLAAARQNDEQAQKRADALAKAMKPSDVEAVKSKIKSWTPEKAPEVANTVQVADPAWQS